MKSDNELFKTLCQKGFKRKKIARVMGISESEVKEMTDRKNAEMIESILSFWRDRLTLGQIAIKMNLEKYQVQYQLKKLDLVD